NGGGAGGVDADAVFVETAAGQPRGGGGRADADDERVAGDPVTVVELDAPDRSRAVQPGDAGRQPDVDALLAVQAREPVAELGAEHARQRRRRGLDDRDLGTEAQRRRGDLQADEPGADDDQARSRAQRATEPPRVAERPQLVHVLVARAAGERTRRASGGDQEPTEGDVATGLQ